MIVYFVILSVPVLFSLSDIFKVEQNRKNKFLILTFLVLLFFAGLRSGDQDYNAYVDIIRELINTSDIFNFQEGAISYIEPGFRILVKFLTLFFKNPVFIFITIAFVAIGINFHCYRKYSPYLFLTIVWYFAHTFLLREMLQIRAGLACAICLYSLQYVEKQYLLKFVLCVLLATTVHAAAFAFLGVYLFFRFHFSKRLMLLMFMCSLIIAVTYPFGQLLSNVENEKISLYFSWSEYNKSINIFSNPTIWKSIVFAAVGWLYYDRMKEKLPSFEVLYHCYFMSIIWLFLFNDFSIIAGRVATFFSITEVILCPAYLMLLKNDIGNQFVGWLAVVIVAALILLLNIYSENVFPYKLISL